MMEAAIDYNLESLNGQSFERMIRALALKLLGSSACVFSSGPDAGRDLTVEGKIGGYEGSSWDGYCVLQCKYRQRDSNQRTDDATWLVDQLKRERKIFEDKSSGRKIPKYYIIVSNVRLSGADGVTNGRIRHGGYSKVKIELDKWKNTLGASDFDIWPYDKVCDLLAGNIDVRQTYSAWISPDDVLSQCIKWMKTKQADFHEVMRSSLLTALRRRQFAELKDAGSVSDPDIRTSQVFIDVPVVSDSIKRQGREPANALFSLMERARWKLDPESLEQADVIGPSPNKIVILGGARAGQIYN